MAIVVEEEQQNSGGGGLIKLFAWVVIIVVIIVAVYYVFFRRPDLVEQATPGATSTQALSKIELKPDEVINSERFQALRSYVQPIEPRGGGRTNPFLGNF
ncbi:MAG: hypothetical protein A2855_00370 [Candidatus Liptonbacteria bacterium RIFCSPHIGHO2_01_FULL_57_28]|uniref:Uncharacterized protein n=1 Tax=Candidatus Liptonbacteria bacterium RIFCSPHIGHO2_01_FULL_57_28 TaxID=1798647 RepID=A0A1G2C8Y9_9BACT|nr:MAG: hypothetical protein A2855_00370 [Candidatus Liptonbacteria bacterium RIFCSPHIGHO2_01_FULL_57_28]HLA40671.1 hypothetical protein [Candidatus Glassbacteria bacterium]